MWVHCSIMWYIIRYYRIVYQCFSNFYLLQCFICEI